MGGFNEIRKLIKIGEFSVVGAVVVKDVPTFTVVGGVPAKVIYYIKEGV